jgi:hypothetical protein
MSNYTTNITLNISKEAAVRLLQLLLPEKDNLEQKLKELTNELIRLDFDFKECTNMIEALKNIDDPNFVIRTQEQYSKEWKWPTKTLFILKQIKRPLTAKEVIKLIEMYEGGVISEVKKTSVFTALTNLTKENKIIRDKPGSEFVYCIPDYRTDSENIFKQEFAKPRHTIKDDILE